MDYMNYFKSQVPEKTEDKSGIIYILEEIYKYLSNLEGSFAQYTIKAIMFMIFVYFCTRSIRNGNRGGSGRMHVSVKKESLNKRAPTFIRWYDYLGKTDTVRRANWQIFLQKYGNLGRENDHNASPRTYPIDATGTNAPTDILNSPPEGMSDAPLVQLLPPAVVPNAPENKTFASICKFSPERNDNAIALALPVAIVSDGASDTKNIKRSPRMISLIRTANQIIGKMDDKLIGSNTRASSLPRVSALNTKQMAISSRNRPTSAIVPKKTQNSISTEARRVAPRITEVIPKSRVNTTTTRGLRAVVPRNGSAILEDKKAQNMAIERNRVPPAGKQNIVRNKEIQMMKRPNAKLTSLTLPKSQPTRTIEKYPRGVKNVITNKIELNAPGDGTTTQPKLHKLFQMRRKEIIQTKEMVVPGGSPNVIVGDTVEPGGTITNTVRAVKFHTAKPTAKEPNIVTCRMSGVASERKRVPPISRRTASAPRCAEVILVNNRMVTAPFKRATTLLGFQRTRACISANIKKSRDTNNTKPIAPAQDISVGECLPSAALTIEDKKIETIAIEMNPIISADVRNVTPKKNSVLNPSEGGAIRRRAVTPNVSRNYLRRDPKINNETTGRDMRKIRSAGKTDFAADNKPKKVK